MREVNLEDLKALQSLLQQHMNIDSELVVPEATLEELGTNIGAIMAHEIPEWLIMQTGKIFICQDLRSITTVRDLLSCLNN